MHFEKRSGDWSCWQPCSDRSDDHGQKNQVAWFLFSTSCLTLRELGESSVHKVSLSQNLLGGGWGTNSPQAIFFTQYGSMHSAQLG